MRQPGLPFGDTPPTTEWVPPTTLPDLSNVTDVSLDSETTGRNPFTAKPVGLAVAWQTDVLNKIYLPIGHASGNLDPEQVKHWARANLKGKRVVGANIKYDIHVLRGWGLDLEELGVQPEDIQFSGALLDDSPHVKVDLDTLGNQYAGLGKLEFPYDMNRMADYPSWMVGPYAERDVQATYLVQQATKPLIKKDELEQVLALENSIIYPVCEIERNGCRIDVEKLEWWRYELHEEYQQELLGLHQLTGIVVEPNSAESMARLFNHLGVTPPSSVAKKVQGGHVKEQKAKRTYSEDELLALKHPVFDKVVRARWLSSLLSKFIDKYYEGVEGDVMRSQFHQLKTDEAGTVSGRFSSSGGGTPGSGFCFNAQQVIGTGLQKSTLGDRHIIRSLFIPNDGMEYFSADQSQIEYRLAAHFANAPKMIEAYKQPDADFHAITQGWIQQYLPSHNNRTITKNTNFAFVFGSGEDTLARTAGITKAESGQLLGIMRKEAPEFPMLLKGLASQAERMGFVRTILGRKSRFGSHETRYYAALNRVVQGSAADIFKIYLRELYRERHTLGVTALRQIVHDEINGDCLPDPVSKARLTDFLNDQKIKLRIPIAWNIAFGANWAECH